MVPSSSLAILKQIMLENMNETQNWRETVEVYLCCFITAYVATVFQSLAHSSENIWG